MLRLTNNNNVGATTAPRLYSQIDFCSSIPVRLFGNSLKFSNANAKIISTGGIKERIVTIQKITAHPRRSPIRFYANDAKECRKTIRIVSAGT
jgi:hypothetical protein